jgi:beta-lactamase superfamily II metal-dependent hydrolase
VNISEETRVYEIDFLQVSTTEKSGDAITARFVDGTGQWRVLVVDAGFTDFGATVQDHINTHYGTNTVDLAVSTHPDADHINGLTQVIEQMDVCELLVHRPALHGVAGRLGKADVAEDLVRVAVCNGVKVTEPFTGLSRFDGMLTVAGPTQEYYRQLLLEAVVERAAVKVGSLAAGRGAGYAFREAVRKALSALPAEHFFDDDGGTTATNNSSVILSLAIGGRRLLLTGDAGVPALNHALDYLDNTGFSAIPLVFMQAPHHGSRHNMDTELLDRLLGTPGTQWGFQQVEAFVSASADAPKHPSPVITNALLRRGAGVYSTEYGHICHSDVPIARPGWGLAPQVPPRDETGEDD